jgi:predicted nuclease of restriction endonuclease-like RecB superfamily
MKPWGHSDLEYGLANDILTKDRVSNFPGEQYTESEMDAMCEKAASDQEKEKCREYNLRETEYYDKRSQLDAKQDKVVKWQLPVEIDGISGEYYVQFPDDLMEAADIKENDMVEWVDRGDGSYLLRKLTKQINMEEC